MDCCLRTEGVPCPSCSGARYCPILSITDLLATFASRRRRVQPTPMGLTPPSFLFIAVREAPKKKGRVSTGMSPASTRLVKAVRDCSSLAPPAPADAPTMSRRCCGRRPSGPPAELLGKDQIACITSPSLTVIALPLGASGKMDSGWGSGCLDLRAAMVASLSLAMVSSEHVKRTTPLKSPSSNFSDTLLASSCSGSWGFWVEGLALLQPKGTGGSLSSANCWFTYLARLQRRPPLVGTRRQRLGNFNRHIQLLALLTTVTSSRMVASFLADWSREACGSLFKSLTYGSVEKSSVGGGV